MIRTFRLTNEAGGLGLSCTEAGLSLAGIPLLRKTAVGFVPRPPNEIAAIMAAAYGIGSDSTRLQPSLKVIAEALNRGNLARATIAAVLTGTPELSRDAASRLRKVAARLRKYDADEPRDWHGRWTSDGTAPPTMVAAPEAVGEASAPAKQVAPQPGKPDQQDTEPKGDVGNNGKGARDASDDDTNDLDAGDDNSDDDSGESPLERKYDHLGPVEFAKEVIQFGDWLGREGQNLSPDDRAQALAEYSFLQDRLSFWLGYDYTPPQAQLNLHSAALTLYQGAVNGGLVGPRDLPPSMLDVAGAAWGADNAPPQIRPATAQPGRELPRPAPELPPQEIKGRGGVLDNSEVGIIWNRGNKDQGEKWEEYNDRLDPEATVLHDNSKGFDQMNYSTGEATSDKALNTLTVSRIRRPQQLLSTMKGYVNAIDDYEPRGGDIDVDPANIKSKTIQLAIPGYTSPMQWRYLNLGIRYARECGVSLVITRIRE